MPEQWNYAVIIPTRDRLEMLARALDSVAGQTELPAEVIVVDNSRTPKVVACAALRAKGVPLQVLSAPLAGNAAVARNLGLSVAASPIVAFLDDDDVWLPGKMEQQIAYLRAHEDCPAVVCGRSVVGGRGAFVESPSPATIARLLPYDNFGGSFSFIVFDRRRAPNLALNPRLMAFQDWDFLLNAARLGPIGSVLQPLAIYSDHEQFRITRTIAGRRQALRILHLAHRAHLDSDPRRWMVSRAWDLRAQEYLAQGAVTAARQCVWKSLWWGRRCRFPRRLKIRSLARRVVAVLPGPLADFFSGIAKRRKVAAAALGQARLPA